MNHYLPAFWSIPASELLENPQTALHDLTSEEVQKNNPAAIHIFWQA